MRDAGSLSRFVPFDLDAGVLESAGPRCSRSTRACRSTQSAVISRRTWLRCPAAAGVVRLPRFHHRQPTRNRVRFLAALAETLQPGDCLLLGTDLVKDTERLVRAYDDGAGVTALFNRNVLAVVNRELAADFDVDSFERRPLERRRSASRCGARRNRPARHDRRPESRGRHGRREMLTGCPASSGPTRSPVNWRGRAAAHPLVDRPGR